MKAFIAVTFIVIFARVQGFEMNEQLMEVGKTCMGKEIVKMEDLITLKEAESDDVDKKIMCFIKCVMEGMGVFKEGALIDEAAVKIMEPHIEADQVKTAVEKCKDQVGTEDCEKAFKISMCIKNNLVV